MTKKIFLMIKKNSMTILGAAILASGVFYVVNTPDIFLASILSLQEQQFITEKGRDIAYKTNSGYVDIFIAETMETPKNLDFSISFDPDTITIDPTNISGQATRTYEIPNQNSINIHTIPNQTIDKNQSILMLPFSGENKDILLSEAISNEKGLSIGSLNTISTHTNK